MSAINPASVVHHHAEAQELQDIGLYLGILSTFFVVTPMGIMFYRLLSRSAAGEGLMAMFTAPYETVPSRRTLSTRTRLFLTQRTRVGYYLDVIQAIFSAVSCVLFIVISYMPAGSEPLWVTDVEDFFTVYFALDYALRLWTARDSLSWYFSMVSLLDFITVFPAITTWIIQAGGEYDTDVALIIASIHVFRVFRIFRVIRVIRLMSVSASYAFQRQVFVLIMTVISLIFVAAGLFQIFESTEAKEYPFHKAVYYAAITVIGRPGVPFNQTITPIFLTIAALLAATIIPTFVAELIRLWFDNASMSDAFAGSPEQRHVILCGDTNVSRLRALVGQYYHKARDPDTQTPIVIIGEPKPEGALRAFLEQFKHSGQVRYVRGSARRAADLRRAGVSNACSIIILNYRPDRDPVAADTEVISTAMAVKSVAPHIRVMAQLVRPRRRNQLKAVPGWQDGDKSVAGIALGMTLLGLGARVPGLPTLLVNLVRHGAPLRGLPEKSIIGTTARPWWQLLMYGSDARPAAVAAMQTAVETASGASAVFKPGDALNAATYGAPSPIEEYAASIDQAVHEFEVTPGLVGLTFAAAARVAYMRYAVTLIAATVPVNADLDEAIKGAGLKFPMPLTYRVALFPSALRLAPGMRLFVVTARPDTDLEAFRVETGGAPKAGVLETVRQVGQAMIPKSVAVLGGAMGINAFQRLQEDPAKEEEGTAASAGSAAARPRGASTGAGAGSDKEGKKYAHNAAAEADLSVPWCPHELDEVVRLRRHEERVEALQSALGLKGAATILNQTVTGIGGVIAHSTGIGGGHSHNAAARPAAATGGVVPSVTGKCDTCARSRTLLFSLAPMCGVGVVTCGEQPSLYSEPEAPAAAPAAAAGAAAAVGSESTDPATPSAAAAPAPAPAAAPEAGRPRVKSVGDDGLGGADDTGDVTGKSGPLSTVPPAFDQSSRIAASAAAAARANINALAVQLALPPTATTEVEALAVEALGTKPAYRGHVLICCNGELNPSAAFLFRALASLLSYSRRAQRRGRAAYAEASPAWAAPVAALPAATDAAASAPAAAPVEGDQYTEWGAADVVLLSPAKPNEGALNALYPGAGRVLSRIAHVSGVPTEAADLIKAGIMTARSCIVLAAGKASASPDGSDNLADDTDTIITTSLACKLNPTLHVITELLHGGHAPYLRPRGAGLNDAQRAAFVHVLEEREAARHLSRMEGLIASLAAEKAAKQLLAASGGRDAAAAAYRTSILLAKLQKQAARLRTMNPAFLRVEGGQALLTAAASSKPIGLVGAAAGAGTGLVAAPGAGAGTGAAPSTAASAGLGASSMSMLLAANELDQRMGTAGAAGGKNGEAAGPDMERLAESGLSTSAIVDVLVGVREDFSPGAKNGGGEGPSNFLSAAASGLTGALTGGNKTSGATNDLFGSPAFAAGRAFTLNTMDSVVLEAHFKPGLTSVIKQFVRAARRGRLVALPATEAVVMARLVTPGAPGFWPGSLAAATSSGEGGVDASPMFDPVSGPLVPEAVLAEARARYLAELAQSIVTAARSGGAEASSGAASTPLSHAPNTVTPSEAGVGAAAGGPASMRTYGEVYEALLRGWRLLPLGLYRRVHPATGLRAGLATIAALQCAAGPPTPGDAFVHNRALVSYVLSNPAPDCPLGEHDLVYCLLPDYTLGGETEEGLGPDGSPLETDPATLPEGNIEGWEARAAAAAAGRFPASAH